MRLCEFVSDEGVPCGEPVRAKGLCTGHYKQRKGGNTLRPLMQMVRGRTGCVFVDERGVKCDRPHHANGWCRAHNLQQWRGRTVTGLRPAAHIVSEREALARAADAWPDYVPDTTFPGTNKDWHGHCRKCGAKCRVRLNQAGTVGHCSNCANHGYNRGKTGYFYFVAGDNWLKGGITNTPKSRLATHRRQGMAAVLHIWEYADGRIPPELEELWKEYRNSLTDNPTKADLKYGYREATRRTVELEQWIEQTFKPLADDLLAAPLAA